MAFESGVIACGREVGLVDRCARLAYQLVRMDPDRPPPMLDLLLDLFREVSPGIVQRAIRLVDLGVEPGRAVVEYARLPGQCDLSPVRAIIRDRQRPELATLACAHASAQIVAWSRFGERWEPQQLSDLALAIVIPAGALRLAEAELGDAESIAARFVTDVEIVLGRLASLHGAKRTRSGEHAAIHLAT